MLIHSFSFDDIPQLSKKDKAYALEKEYLLPFIQAFPSAESIVQQARLKSSTFSDSKRRLLTEVLEHQYSSLQNFQPVIENIKQLNKPTTFTIITAHQPSLLTGPLYYIFKILSAVNIAEKLNKDSDEFHFVPLFISGGEDHDLDEVKYCNLFGKQINWDRTQEGSVGRMSIEGLDKVLAEVSGILGEHSKAKDLIEEIKGFLSTSKNYAAFQANMVNRLFGKYGLICLNMDEPKLKNAFVSIMEEELIHTPSKSLVETTQNQLEALNHSAQAHAREVNLFLHHRSERRRIQKTSEKSFGLVGTDKKYDHNEILAKLKDEPESFSPNVVMRPLYQEYCLPNVAYVGGGGEIAYWLERKSQFDHFNILFPILIRRNSALIFEEKDAKIWDSLQLDHASLFNDFDSVVNQLIKQESSTSLSLQKQREISNELFAEIAKIAETIDPTLSSSILATSSKQIKLIDQFESRLKRAVKAKSETKVNKIRKIKNRLFPNNGLQERSDNIFQYISKYGEGFIDDLKTSLEPLSKQFVVLQLESSDYPS